MRTVMAKGLKITVRCTSKCKISGKARRGTKLVGTGTRTVSGKASTLTIKPSTRGRRLLATGKKVELTVTITATSAGVSPATRTFKVVLPKR